MTRISMLTLIVVGLGALSAACVPPQGARSGAASAGPSASDPLGQIAGFAVTDLQAAEAEATAQNDAIAKPCYPALVAFVQSLQAQAGTLTGGTSVKGGFSGFQAARGLRLTVEAGAASGLKSLVPDYLKLGCSALVLDEQTFLVKLAALAGAGAVTAGIGPALAPAIPALLPKLP